MDDDGSRSCPYCAEKISPAAVRCPHCRSHLYLRDPQRWHRAHPGRKVAGVCVALSRALGLPVTPIRLGFLLLTLLHFVGALAYLVLWAVIPREAGHEPPVVRAVEWGAETIRRLFGKDKPRGGPGSGDVDISGVS